MRLKKNGARLVSFVIDFANGKENPCLARRFADTIDVAYEHCSWMEDEPFRQAIGDAVDEFLGRGPIADIY